MKLSKRIFNTVLTIGLLSLSSGASASFIGDIIAGYDYSQENSYFTVQNTSGFDLTNIVFTASDGASFSGTWHFGNVLAGGSSTQYFADTGNAFQVDFDDSYSGGGDIKYLLTASWDGHTLYSSFSANDNYTGGFLGFLGNDIYGAEYDVSLSGVAAVLAVPEAEQYALLLLGLPMIAVAAKRKSA
ncbi:hypothetical protein KEF85_07040 [Methylomonas paludis]|uniref:Secreted protein with PEP-CTERM sorting signal n=1 Tax=Methylomonas paludis TaxID=1173101 RepID=A0A975RBA4_9GAMM|nr:hypothetical protein [Methylomonas paludis]QWF72198.1 hypothetical protein KEF85_07040 [Methylomonas paludis]